MEQQRKTLGANFKMLTAVLDGITTLPEFYKSIRSQQEEYHGKSYCAHNDAIKKYSSDCKSYKELGTNQGATAAAAVFAEFKNITLVDIDHYKLGLAKRYSKHTATSMVLI